ncbi:MAG: hypothetical protein OXG71_10120 [Rhodospirillales bacterium]|nr:hypothetical protein [Rhodospirillales bacterium]MCY3855046.1 hypothetical protein [Rhodospirillales bacterium]
MSTPRRSIDESSAISKRGAGDGYGSVAVPNYAATSMTDQRSVSAPHVAFVIVNWLTYIRMS